MSAGIDIEGVPLKMQVSLDTKEVEKEYRKTLEKLKRENDKFWNEATRGKTSAGGFSTTNKNRTSATPIVDQKANKTIQDAINALSTLEVRSVEVAKQIANLKLQSSDLSGAKKELVRQYRSAEISADQYKIALSGIEMEQRRVSLGLLDLNRAVKQNIQLENVAVGSLEEARIKYNQLTQAITKAGGAMDGSNPAVSKMIDQHKKLRTEIDTMEQKMGQYQRNVGNYASGWNGMQNSINQIARELPAFTFSAQTGFLAISNNVPIAVDEINKAITANKALTASGQKAVPVWKQVAGAIFSGQTAMMLAITAVTIYGKEISEWVKTLFKGKDALEQLKKEKKEFAEVSVKGAQDAQNEIVSLKSLYRATQNSSLSYAERTKAVKQMQSQYPSYFKNLSNESVLAGNAKVAYEALTNSILAAAKARAYESKIAEISSKQIENTDKILEKANSISPGDRKAMQMDSKTIASGGMMMFTTASKDAYQAVEAIKELNKENASLAQSAERYQKAVDNLVKSNGVSILTGDFKVGKVNKISNKELNEYKSLLEKVSDLDREYARIEMSDDDSEIAAVKDKFSDITKLIEEYNKKNPKIKIDVEQVNAIKDKAIENLKFEQGTTQLAKDIDEQKRLIEKYENYRTRFGAEKANERYKNELGLIKSYRSRLEQEYINLVGSDSTASLSSGNPTKKLTKAEQSRADMLEKEIKESKDAEIEKQEAMLATLISYEGERKKLIEEYNTQRKELIEQNKSDEVAVLDEKHREELNSLDDADIKKLQAYKDLFDGIEDLTDAGARRVIAASKDMLASMVNISPDERKKIENQIKRAEDSLTQRLPKRTLLVADAFREMADAAKEVNEELSVMLGGLANVLRATVQVSDGIKGLKEGLTNYKDNKLSGGGGILGTISAVAGVAGPVGQIVGAVSSVVSGVVGFFKASKESARQAAAQIKEYQQSILQGELEYNKILRERLRTQKDINELTNLEIKAQQELLRQQGGNVLNDYTKALRDLQTGGQQITGQKTEKYGGFLGIGKKTRVVDITAGLAGKTYEELEKLYTSNKLTESTKKQFEALRALKDEVDDIASLWDDAQRALVDRMSGGITGDSITKSIIDGIKNGKRAFQDFGDDIENIIQEALLNGMAYQYLDAPVKALVEQFQKDSLDGLNTSEIEAFKNGYDAIMKTASEQIKSIESALGKSIGDNSNSSLKSGIERTSMSEKSSNEIKGSINNKFKINI